jgi:hypothetical protein
MRRTASALLVSLDMLGEAASPSARGHALLLAAAHYS